VIDGRLETVLSLKEAAQEESIILECDHCLDHAELLRYCAGTTLPPQLVLMRLPPDHTVVNEILETISTYLSRSILPLILLARQLPIAGVKDRMGHPLGTSMLTPSTPEEYRTVIKRLIGMISTGASGRLKQLGARHAF
jgi:hypothetical protein